jgi:hypothetical protein
MTRQDLNNTIKQVLDPLINHRQGQLVIEKETDRRTSNGALAPAVITIECKIDHATIDIHRKIIGHTPVNSHNHRTDHI